MDNDNHFSRKLLAAVAIVKEAIDMEFKLVTGTHPQPDTRNAIDWKNAKIFAKETQVKRYDLQKCFVWKYGKKISEYQLEIKMKAACILLADGDMTKKEIAFKCGYSNQNHFSHAFKKQKRLTPTEWQIKNSSRKLNS